MKILGKYKIEYSNGFVQEKNLISTEDYNNIAKTADTLIGHLEIIKKSEHHAHTVKGIVSEMFGDYFTDSSPMFDAIKSGKLELLPQQGGSHNIKVKRI